jgi:ABC-type uncharacterized transport system substrate-binding protein
MSGGDVEKYCREGRIREISDYCETDVVNTYLPGLRRLAILADVGYPAAALEMREAQTTARSLGLEVVTLEIRQAEDIAPAFEAHKGDADALYVGGSPSSS